VESALVGPGVTQPGVQVGGGGNNVEDVGLAPARSGEVMAWLNSSTQVGGFVGSVAREFTAGW
jgi:hypothetical protein